MKKAQIGSARIAIISILSVVVIAVIGGVAWWTLAGSKKNDTQTTTPPSTTKPVEEKKTEPPKTYVDTKQSTGLALTYPSAWQVSEQYTPDSAEATAGGYGDAKNLVTFKSSDGTQEVELDIYTSPGLGGACEGDKISSIEYEAIPAMATLNYVAVTKTVSGGKLAFLAGAFPKASLKDPVVDGDGCQLTSTSFYFQPGKDATKRATLTIHSSNIHEDKWNLKPSVTKMDIHHETETSAFKEAKAIVLSLHIQ
jgi:hypothetical protein